MTTETYEALRGKFRAAKLDGDDARIMTFDDAFDWARMLDEEGGKVVSIDAKTFSTEWEVTYPDPRDGSTLRVERWLTWIEGAAVGL